MGNAYDSSTLGKFADRDSLGEAVCSILGTHVWWLHNDP
jgi:hypothetical protein